MLCAFIITNYPMEKIEILQNQIEEQKLKLQDLENDLLIQQAISKIEIKDLKNNLLNDVRLAKATTLTLDELYIIALNLNGKEIRYNLEIPYHLTSSRNIRISEKISELIFKEITKNINVLF